MAFSCNFQYCVLQHARSFPSRTRLPLQDTVYSIAAVWSFRQYTYELCVSTKMSCLHCYATRSLRRFSRRLFFTQLILFLLCLYVSYQPGCSWNSVSWSLSFMCPEWTRPLTLMATSPSTTISLSLSPASSFLYITRYEPAVARVSTTSVVVC